MDNSKHNLVNLNITVETDVSDEDVKALAVSYLMFKIGKYSVCF